MEERQQRKQYAFVVKQLTSREIKRKYARSYLGIVWSVLNPLLSMAVLSLIFSQLFRRSIENYSVAGIHRGNKCRYDHLSGQ